MRINATDNHIIITSKTMVGSIFVGQPLDNCKIEIEEYFFVDGDEFSRSGERIIFTAKQGINLIDNFEFKKCDRRNIICVIRASKDCTFINLENSSTSETENIYKLIITTLNGKDLNLECYSSDIREVKWRQRNYDYYTRIGR